jgi:hypothetical protein
MKLKLTEEQHLKFKEYLEQHIGKALNEYRYSKQYSLDCFTTNKRDQIGRKIACKIINETAHRTFPDSIDGRNSFKRYVDTFYKLKGPYNWSHFK